MSIQNLHMRGSKLRTLSKVKNVKLRTLSKVHILWTFDLVSFFLFFLNALLQRRKSFLFCERKKKVHKTKTIEWYNELKPTKNKFAHPYISYMANERL